MLFMFSTTPSLVALIIGITGAAPFDLGSRTPSRAEIHTSIGTSLFLNQNAAPGQLTDIGHFKIETLVAISTAITGGSQAGVLIPEQPMMKRYVVHCTLDCRRARSAGIRIQTVCAL